MQIARLACGAAAAFAFVFTLVLVPAPARASDQTALPGDAVETVRHMRHGSNWSQPAFYTLGSASSVGAYGGLTLNGSVRAPKSEWNEDFYGREVSVREILAGKVSSRATGELRQALRRAL